MSNAEKKANWKIFLVALAVTLLSLFLSLLVTYIVTHILHGYMNHTSVVIATIVPTVVAGPVTWFVESYRQKANDALARLQVLKDELEHQANHDTLTGILNRRSFIAGVADKTDGVLISIDVDHFKRINDTYGHAAGDMALVQITQAISNAVRESDLFARLGGEEFAVFANDASYENAKDLAERIRLSVNAVDFSPEEGVHHELSVSIGSAFGSESKDFDAMVALADQRLYYAKENGRNRAIFPDVGDLKQVA
ncbi:GGDEF domain-containing protein [uncultured Cohaesibacter sp.]|uniref:GGDEF domain-containing protein n=1 Tax=uncultured Cohaesibacter sp. TaxID=1002546 RepID=UPI00292D4893|nr:GGDEF domain-containing protein [uncultured Cohaesibacter sp.]